MMLPSSDRPVMLRRSKIGVSRSIPVEIPSNIPWGSVFAYGLMAMLAILALAPLILALK
jgi:hypothetical protein